MARLTGSSTKLVTVEPPDVQEASRLKPGALVESKSYNRKFQCGCRASNEYPVTVWSTRLIDATCNVCKQTYVEVPKDKRGGKVIVPKLSHVEVDGQDAVQEAMRKTFNTFRRFESKTLKKAFLEALLTWYPGVYASGVYQKGHNGRKMGYTHWLAYNDDPANQEPPAPKAKEKPTVPKPSEAKGKVLKFTPKESEAPAQPPKEEREYNVDNPQDIIDLYRELGSVKAVGQKLGKAQSTISDRIKKHAINFSDGTFKQVE